MLALFLSLVFKKADIDEEEEDMEDEEQFKLAHDEQWLHPVTGTAGRPLRQIV